MHIEEILTKLNIYFLIKDNKLLEKYNRIWNKFGNVIKKGFDNDPVLNDKYLKTKIKYYEIKVNPNLHNDKMPKEGSQCICQSMVLIDSVFEMGKNYYPQLILER